MWPGKNAFWMRSVGPKGLVTPFAGLRERQQNRKVSRRVTEQFKNKLRGIKRKLLLARSAVIEKAFLSQIRIDRSASPEAVRDIIALLRPRKIDKPLIRVGSNGDGGYLMPDDFEGLVGCVSPGVAGEVGFDLEMAERGLKVAMADASVAGPPVDHANFFFEKKFLGTHNDASTVRLADFVDAHFPEGDLILQMDIEGAEFPVLLDCPDETLSRFRMIVLEVHDFNHVFGQFSSGIMKAFVNKLMRSHSVVHIHPNNCCGSERRHGIEIPRVLEFTLSRKDRGVSDTYANLPNPHPLDVDNVPSLAHLKLPQIWISD